MPKGLQVEQFLAGWTDASGQPLSGGKIWTYAAGTLTPQALFTDKDCTTPATNPVILDSQGRKQVYADSSLSYKFIVRNSADVLLYTLDHLFYPREILFSDSGTGYSITNTTSDGSDNKRLLLNGGGASGSGRGAEIQLHGNESSGNAGRARLSSGNISAATVDLDVVPSNGKLRILLNGVARWEFDAATNSILPTATNAHDIGSTGARVRNIFAQTLNSSANRGDGFFNTLDIPVQTWTPTFGAGGSMTVASSSVTNASYSQLGKFVFFILHYQIEFATAANTFSSATLPFTTTSVGSVVGQYETAAANSMRPCLGAYASNAIQVRRQDHSNWDIGTLYTMRFSGVFRVS